MFIQLKFDYLFNYIAYVKKLKHKVCKIAMYNNTG